MEIVRNSHKPLSMFTLIMINVIAVDSLRTLPISAVYGLPLIFFYLLAAIIFFIPIALITAELATGWPKTGGLYVWVQAAFGDRTGLIAIWLQWVYNVVWYPTILAFLAATFAYLFNPSWAHHPIYILSIVLGMLWTVTGINCLGMRVSSLLSTIGTLMGTLLPMLLIIGLGAAWLLNDKPTTIHFSWQNLFPATSHIENLAFLSAVLFGLIGLEMSASHAEEVANPQRDYPRALFYSAFIILFTLMFASLAIAIVIPSQQLSLVSGLIDAFAIFFDVFRLGWMKHIIVIMIILGGVSCVSAWIIGPTKGLLAAARQGSLPALFKKTNRKHAPVNILLMQALLVTLLSSVFLLFDSINSAYWFLSALTAQLALIVYLLMFAAAIKLRYSHHHVERAYRIPGGNLMMWIIGLIGMSACIGGILIGFIPPETLHIKHPSYYMLSLLIGMLLLSLLPLIMFKSKNKIEN